MQLSETIASQPPLDVRWIALETMSREQQLSSEFVAALYRQHGKPVPTWATQDWYDNQGYMVFAVEHGIHTWVSRVTGRTEDSHNVFLMKELQQKGPADRVVVCTRK